MIFHLEIQTLILTLFYSRDSNSLTHVRARKSFFAYGSLLCSNPQEYTSRFLIPFRSCPNVHARDPGKIKIS